MMTEQQLVQALEDCEKQQKYLSRMIDEVDASLQTNLRIIDRLKQEFWVIILMVFTMGFIFGITLMRMVQA